MSEQPTEPASRIEKEPSHDPLKNRAASASPSNPAADRPVDSRDSTTPPPAAKAADTDRESPSDAAESRPPRKRAARKSTAGSGTGNSRKPRSRAEAPERSNDKDQAPLQVQPELLAAPDNRPHDYESPPQSKAEGEARPAANSEGAAAPSSSEDTGRPSFRDRAPSGNRPSREESGSGSSSGGGEGQSREQQSTSGSGYGSDARDRSRRGRTRSRNKRKRERDKDRGGDRGERSERGDRGDRGDRERGDRERGGDPREKETPSGPPVETEGMLEISPKGFGFLRQRKLNFQQSPSDVFVTPEVVRIHGLRDGVWIKCLAREGNRGPQLTEIIDVNGLQPDAYTKLPYFEELTATNPNKKLTFETIPTRYTTRVIDMMTPVGRGQRGLIVAPPRTGKTTLLQHMAEAILENYGDTMKLMILLVDERPEEVTDFLREVPEAEILASSNDQDVKSHTRIAQLAIERAKRLVEAGEHVFLLLDSITRLTRAFNNSINGKGRGIGSGGLTHGALEIPRKLFAAARNTREAGSLTIIATALIQTNSKMDDAIFQEFKGTGNMELVLDRQIAQQYVWPAVDIHKSGTRREELLLAGHQLDKIHVLRRGLSGHKPVEAMERLLSFLERFPTNAQMLMEIKTTAVA